MLTIHCEYLTGLIIGQWDFVSIELIQIAHYGAGPIVLCSSSVRVIARSNMSQVPPLHMYAGKPTAASWQPRGWYM